MIHEFSVRYLWIRRYKVGLLFAMYSFWPWEKLYPRFNTTSLEELINIFYQHYILKHTAQQCKLMDSKPNLTLLSWEKMKFNSSCTVLAVIKCHQHKAQCWWFVSPWVYSSLGIWQTKHRKGCLSWGNQKFAWSLCDLCCVSASVWNGCGIMDLIWDPHESGFWMTKMQLSETSSDVLVFGPVVISTVSVLLCEHNPTCIDVPSQVLWMF